jgi:methylase of polypeptide subunit release factors
VLDGEPACGGRAGPLSPFQVFFQNHNLVVGTIWVTVPIGSGSGRRFDAARAACYPEMHAALARLGDALRASGYDNTPAGGSLARLALGFTVERGTLRPALGERAMEILVSGGVAVESTNGVRLHGAVFADGPGLAFVRRDGSEADRVYIGDDSLLLQEAVRCLAVPGERAAELGTGTGLAAVSLADDYRVVVATDVVKGLVGGVALTTALNRIPDGHRIVACVADVARGLRPGTQDFVAANTPWVPSSLARSVVYADGGPTGTELPSRFVVEGTRLLRPGGAGVFLMVEITFANGRSPLRDLSDRMRAGGLFTAVLPTPYSPVEGRWDRLAADLPGAVSARHVALVVAKPPLDDGRTGALARLTSAWAAATPRR